MFIYIVVILKTSVCARFAYARHSTFNIKVLLYCLTVRFDFADIYVADLRNLLQKAKVNI